MNWFSSKPAKPPERFYLLPGQGGEAFRRKRRIILTWSVLVALLVSGAMVALLLYMNRTRP